MAVNIAVPTSLTTGHSTELDLRVDCIRREANGVISLELRAPGGEALPTWTPGSHIQLRLASGLIRQYSLCGRAQRGAPYRIAILREKDGRGGSREVHDSVRVGDIVRAEGPLNNFKLRDGERYLFIAGGIGITPILPMVASVDGSREWSLAYLGRSRGDMAFVSEIERFPADRVALYPKDKAGRLDLATLIAHCTEGTQVYACGPPGMLDALATLCDARPDISLFIERFAASAKQEAAVTHAPEESFEVFLQRLGITLTIPPGSTILQEVRKVVPSVPFSCESGYCGTCEVRVISGEVDHRDSLLTSDEKEKNKTMMICVSRGCGRLVLDM